MFGPLLSVIGRPNALDREVTGLPVASLLHSSPADLIDPARAAAALHLQQFSAPMWVVMIALQITALAWFWSSGHSARLRDRLRTMAPSEFVARFFFGALLAGIDKLAAFIPQALQYRYMRILDLNNILFRSWLVEWIGATLFVMAVAGAVAALVLWLADRTHQWYLYTIAALMGFTLLVSYVNPFAIAPAYAHFTGVSLDADMQRDVSVLQAKAGVSVPIVQVLQSRRTHVGDAYVLGWGGSQRAVITDTLLAAATPDELRFVFARAMAWVAANSGLQRALVQGAFLILGAALAVFVSDRIGFRRDDDPVSRLALLGAVMGAVYLLALPFYNGYARQLDRLNDSAALALTNDRAGAIRLEVRRADQDLVPLCPNTIAYWYLDSRVPPGTRISDLRGAPDYCRTTQPR